MLLVNTDYTTDKNLAEGVVGQMEKLGIRVVLNSLDGKQRDASMYAGRFDWMVHRNQAELASVVQNTSQLAATGPRTSWHHRAPEGGQLDLMPFEQQLVDIVNKFIASNDNAERTELMKQYEKVATANVELGRPDRISRRADHQQALLQHSSRRSDLHVQLGGGHDYPRTGVREGRQAGQTTNCSPNSCRASLATAVRSTNASQVRSPPVGPKAAAGGAPTPKDWRPPGALGQPTPQRSNAVFRFLLMRIASAIPLLLVLSVVTFAIIQAPPGDYSDYIRSQAINQGGASYEEAEAQAQAYRVANGLDKPLPVQYVNWIAGIVTRGDFGHSLYYNKPVADVVGERLPRTLLWRLSAISWRRSSASPSASSPRRGNIHGSTRCFPASPFSA